MNKQRKVLITITYNEMGIIIDTKAEEVAQPEPCEDTVSRQRLLSDLKELVAAWKEYPVMAKEIKGVEAAIGYVEEIPPVKPESKELGPTHKALDTISRQAAIDAISAVFPVEPNKSEYASGIACGAALALTYIKQLPSAQAEIIHCCDCIYYDPEHIEKNGVRYEYKDITKFLEGTILSYNDTKVGDRVRIMGTVTDISESGVQTIRPDTDSEGYVKARKIEGEEDDHD